MPNPMPLAGVGEPGYVMGIEPGSDIGNYVVRSQIARGGFGTIWRVTHAETGQVAALKILHADLIFSEELVLRFEREANAVALIRHPNIIGVYERGKLSDGRPYFVMEYVEGTALDSHLSSRGTLSPREVLDVLSQLGDALSAAHTLGVVHRDLKASNVLLSERDGALRVVLLDFGIAKLLEHSGPRLTAPHAMIGTPSCMAPEQIRCEPVSALTDVYALGSLAYQMLTGKLPFSNRNMVSTLYLHLHAPPPRPSESGNVSPVFDEVIVKAMAKESSQRYASALEFVAAFRAAVQETIGSATDEPETSATMAALGVYLNVTADQQFLDDPDDELLDDMESLLPETEQHLRTLGYVLAHENGNSALFVRSLSPDPADSAATRNQAIEATRQLFEKLSARPGRDDRVNVSLCLHVGDVSMDEDVVRGGVLLDLDGWVPTISASGVFGSAALLHGLSLSATPVTDSPIQFHRLMSGE